MPRIDCRNFVAASRDEIADRAAEKQHQQRFAVAPLRAHFSESGQIFALIADDRNRVRYRRVRGGTTARRCAKFQSGSNRWAAFYTAPRESGVSCDRCRCRVRPLSHASAGPRRCPWHVRFSTRSSARVTPYSGRAVMTSKSAEPTLSYRYIDGNSFCGWCVRPAWTASAKGLANRGDRAGWIMTSPSMQRFYSPRGAQGTTRRDAAWVYRRERQPVGCWLAERGDMESLRIKKLIAADVASGER